MTFTTATVVTAHVDQLASATLDDGVLILDLAGSVIKLTGHPNDLADLVHKINVAVGE